MSRQHRELRRLLQAVDTLSDERAEALAREHGVPVETVRRVHGAAGRTYRRDYQAKKKKEGV